MRLWCWLLCASLPLQAAPLVVVTEIFPPYQQLNEQAQLTGWSVDIVRQVFAEAALDLRIETLPWPRAFKMATDQPETYIFSMLQTRERLAGFRWVVPLCPMRVSFYTTQNRPEVDPQNLLEARKFMVGVEQGQANYRFLLNNGFRENKNLMLVGQNHQLPQMIMQKRIDMVLMSDLYVAQQYRNTPVQLRKLFSVSALELMLFLAAHKDSQEATVQRLQQAYQRLYGQTPPQCQRDS